MTEQEELAKLIREQARDMAQDRTGIRETVAHETYRRACPKGDSLGWILSDDSNAVLPAAWYDPRTPQRGSNDG